MVQFDKLVRIAGYCPNLSFKIVQLTLIKINTEYTIHCEYVCVLLNFVHTSTHIDGYK